MSNAMRRDICAGEVVVVKAECFNNENLPIEQRMFRADSGFGMSNTTSGSAVFGAFLDQTFYGIPDHENHIRIEGHMIDRAETEKLQAANDWAVLPVTPSRPDPEGRKSGFGVHDLFDRYHVDVDVMEDGTYVVRGVVKGEFEFIPITTDTKQRAYVVMENMYRLINDKEIMNRTELEEFEAKKGIDRF
jgi:hypothetical protein